MDRVIIIARRILYFAPVFSMTVLGMDAMHSVLSEQGVRTIEWVMFGLFSLSFLWIAMYFWNAVIGFGLYMTSSRPARAAVPILEDLDNNALITARTAIIMPVYNEDPDRSARRLLSTWQSLKSAGQADRFDFFMLSDTTDPAIAARECNAVDWLRQEMPDAALHYRQRPNNAGRKAGNILDFGHRWGREYDFMIVLDADSVMSGDLMQSLVRLMQANEDVGIVQTVPRPILAETLFGRVHQFGARVTAEVLNAGVSFWQMGEGNYFGHNAIIRCKAFFDHCRLPVLPGKGPLAGEILSHDFVEAAYLRRAGFKVWNIPVGNGSYEETPPSLLDYAKRDRRWCQGNLQHSRILFEKGLHPLSRLHLLGGIMSYLSSPLWLLFIGLSVATVILEANPSLDYVGPGSMRFALLPTELNLGAIALFGAVMAMLLAPKLLGALATLFSRERRRGFGGGVSLMIGAMLEMLISIINAPIMMMFHTGFVLSVLFGRSVRWDPQTRDGYNVSTLDAIRDHKWALLFAVVLSAVVLGYTPSSAVWFIPLVFGPFLSPLLTRLTSRADYGQAARRLGLFLTPEETGPVREVTPLRVPGPLTGVVLGQQT